MKKDFIKLDFLGRLSHLAFIPLMMLNASFMKKPLLLSTLSLPFFAILATADTYSMIKEYAGTHFFDDWTFYDHCELGAHFNRYLQS